MGDGIGVGVASWLPLLQAERAARMTGRARSVAREVSLREVEEFLTVGCLIVMDGKEAGVGS